MDKKLLNYLKSYSQEPAQTDRLLVSAFITLNRLKVVQNRLLLEYFIKEGDKDHAALNEFLEHKGLVTLEELIEAFEFVISPADKIVTGAVYTPELIRRYIIKNVLKCADIKVTICDPACGCGGFLLSAAEEVKKRTNQPYKEIFEKNLYGLDIHGYSTTRSKLLLSLLALQAGEDEADIAFNFFVGNALNFKWQDRIRGFHGFSVLVGNPPYVASRNIDGESKELLPSWSVCATGHPDLYIPFFQIGMEWLRQGGVLGYITMNTFFKSLNGRALRDYFQNASFGIKILDFGSLQVFHSKSTYTCICIINKAQGTGILYKKVEELSFLHRGLNGFEAIPYLKLHAEKGWNLQRAETISAIEATGTPFSELFQTRNGIATLMNDVYIFNPVKEDARYYYLQKGECEYRIERSVCKEVVNTNRLSQVIKEKIIFPYVYKKGERVPVPMDENLFKSKYPSAYAYLEHHKKVLATRDKGGGAKYQPWFAFGRNQCLDKFKYKLFFPHITSGTPHFVLNDDEDLLFVNGLAAVSDKKSDLMFLQRLLSTKLFWFYVAHTSKPYGSGFYSLSKNYIKNFGVFGFTESEKHFIIGERNQKKVNAFIESRYKIEY
jgi:adenine-specific DNA-methyltransferase